MEASRGKPLTGSYVALALLLAINLFNYIDRQILAALEPDIRAAFFAPNDPNAMMRTGWLGDAFFVPSLVSGRFLGWFAVRVSRWIFIGSVVFFCCLACGGSGWVGLFALVFVRD